MNQDSGLLDDFFRDKVKCGNSVRRLLKRVPYEPHANSSHLFLIQIEDQKIRGREEGGKYMRKWD